MDKKHIAIGVGVITFVGITLTIILIWMMNYQSDVVMSSPPNQSFRWQSLKPTEPDPAENFTAEIPEDTVSEPIEQPAENSVVDQEEEATEEATDESHSPVPVVSEQPKIPWSQFNKSLLTLEQEQAAIMTLLAQKYSSVVEPETQVVEPAAKVIEPNSKAVEIEPETSKTVATATKIVAPNLKPVEIEPETPKTVATKTEIIATTAQPVKPETNMLTTTTEVAELTNLLGEKTVAKPLEVAWETDLFINLNSNSWLKVAQQIFELEQWREKTIHSLSIKVDRQGNQENNK